MVNTVHVEESHVFISLVKDANHLTLSDLYSSWYLGYKAGSSILFCDKQGLFEPHFNINVSDI